MTTSLLCSAESFYILICSERELTFTFVHVRYLLSPFHEQTVSLSPPTKYIHFPKPPEYIPAYYYAASEYCVYIDSACYYRHSSVVCRSVTVVSPARMAQPIEMPFGLRTPPQRGTAPNFRPISVVAKWLGGSRCHLV